MICFIWQNEVWIWIKEIAEYLGERWETIYKWVEAKEMPGHRIGRSWKFKKEEVDAWVKSGKAGEQIKNGEDI